MSDAFTVNTPPPSVGHYILRDEPYGKIIWQWSKRPSWWHRLTFRVFFGFRWIDEPPRKDTGPT